MVLTEELDILFTFSLLVPPLVRTEDVLDGEIEKELGDHESNMV